VAYSGQSKIAFDHGFRDALYGRDRNNPYDINTVGKSCCAYDEGYALGLISEQPPRGPKGASMLTGAGPPSRGLGVVPDVYIDCDSGAIYKKTGSNLWAYQGPGTG